MKLSTEAEAKQLILSILPETEPRQKCLIMFAESIAEANIYGRNKWAVKCETGRDRLVRLIVGHLIVCTLVDGRIWLALDKGLLENSRRQPLLNQSDDWKWDDSEWAEYREIPSRNGYYRPSETHSELWPEIRRLHFESIYKAANGKPLDPRTPQGHEPEILKYLRNELGRHVPDPLY